MKKHFIDIVHLFGRIASPLIFLIIVVFSFISSSTASSSSWLLIFGDKGAHMLSYFALGFCLFCAYMRPSEHYALVPMVRSNYKRISALWVLIILFGTMVEILQPRFGRGFEFFDIVADAVGSIVGIFFSVFIIDIAHRLLVKKGSNS